MVSKTAPSYILSCMRGGGGHNDEKKLINIVFPDNAAQSVLPHFQTFCKKGSKDHWSEYYILMLLHQLWMGKYLKKFTVKKHSLN